MLNISIDAKQIVVFLFVRLVSQNGFTPKWCHPKMVTPEAGRPPLATPLAETYPAPIQYSDFVQNVFAVKMAIFKGGIVHFHPDFLLIMSECLEL